MGDMTMKEFIEYHLSFVREHLVHAANTTPQDFYDGGQDWESLELHDVVVVESLAHSWGCLEGAAAMADLTIGELLGQYGLQLNAKPDEDDEFIECAWCEKRIRFVDSYSPGDEAICAECNKEVPREPKRRPACPKCGSRVTHRCKTGECRHCNKCEHAWIPEEARRG